MQNQKITCPHCGRKINSDDAQRLCSNCFACTGCERYLCYFCDNTIIISDVRKIGEKREGFLDK